MPAGGRRCEPGSRGPKSRIQEPTACAALSQGRTVLLWRFDLPRGHRDVGRQLDALAHVIAKDEIKRVAAQWGITRNGVYQLARSAVKSLQQPRRRSRRRARPADRMRG